MEGFLSPVTVKRRVCVYRAPLIKRLVSTYWTVELGSATGNPTANATCSASGVG